jgi:hypothetical protein
MAYKAELPPGISLPPGASIDTSSSRYKELEALATSQKWTQDAFSGVLGMRPSASRTPVPAPAPRHLLRLRRQPRRSHSRI